MVQQIRDLGSEREIQILETTLAELDEKGGRLEALRPGFRRANRQER